MNPSPAAFGSAVRRSSNYLGGQTDAVVTSFDLVLTGIELHGTSTPSCLGPLHLNATEMPRADALRFALWTSAAPPLSQGWLLLGQPTSSPATILGVDLWLDRTQPIARVRIESDERGYVETRIPLPSGSTGRTFAAQTLLRNTPSCGTVGTWSASNAVIVSVQ